LAGAIICLTQVVCGILLTSGSKKDIDGQMFDLQLFAQPVALREIDINKNFYSILTTVGPGFLNYKEFIMEGILRG